ncbi:copper-transporting atpase ran1 [Nicotiana attenuata]|uniref:Copper-transporting atpase ran1 n=1 Tax=Nicotiana attenuata TaxID=49451 RepID=A0A1J6IJ10_NICAT|nr:copper-transporting atpase ran1 [Nicotiana attenuata]
MGTREVYEEKLKRGNLHHDPTIKPGLGSPRCPRCLSLLNPTSKNGEWAITPVLHDVTGVMGGGTVVSATDVAPTHKDPLTMATRFRSNKKKRGYVSACYRCMGKCRKHLGRANTGGMHHPKILFHKYLSSYTGKVGMRNEIELQCRFDNKESFVVHIDGRDCGVLVNQVGKMFDERIKRNESEWICPFAKEELDIIESEVEFNGSGYVQSDNVERQKKEEPPLEVTEEELVYISRCRNKKLLYEKHIQLTIGAMTCATCVNSVEDILRKLPRVRKAVVVLATSLGRGRYGLSIISEDDILNVTEYVSFEVSVVQCNEQVMIVLRVVGLSAKMDVQLMEVILPKLHGVKQTYVERKTRKLEVALDLEVLGSRSLIDRIKVLVLPNAMVLWQCDPFILGDWIEWALVITVQFVIGVLLYGTISRLWSPTYLGKGALLIIYVLLGKFLKAPTKGKASDDIKKLYLLQGEVNALLIQPGDVLKMLLIIPCNEVCLNIR